MDGLWMRTTAAAALLTALTACATSPAPPPPAPASTATAAAGQSAAPVVPLAQACAFTTVPGDVEQRQVPLPSGSPLSTAWLGSGSTVAVLLHQTDGNGLCGFLFYADVLARRGLRVALLDLCGYGQSAGCVDTQTGSGVTDQVGAVVAAARAEGARRVVLVGASMGGSVAVTTAGAVHADALVDLSGPSQFNTSDLGRDAPSVTMPALFAFGRDTDPSDLADVRAALPAMPTRAKKVLTAASGHGYELLQDADGGRGPLASAVTRFVTTGRLP
jgi:pimeloyl-ACP methyl ester carboxylesterase